MNVEFTEQQAAANIELMNIAVKAGGLQVAQAALVIAGILDQAMKQSAQAAQPVQAPQAG